MKQSLPVVWTVAGTDPTSGAGIQADLQVMNRLGVHGCSVITAVIAQHTRGVQMIEFPTEHIIHAQLDALAEDMPPAAVKIGMLGNLPTAQAVYETVSGIQAFTVYDPVQSSSGGTSLLTADAEKWITRHLLPHINLLTPNIPEAESITGNSIRTPNDVEQTAKQLLKTGVSAVVLKGGHRNHLYCRDFFTDGSTDCWLTSPRIHTDSTHGTGCVFSSAVAACMALGYTLPDAVILAKAYINQGMHRAIALGHGKGPLRLNGWPVDPENLPWLTEHADQGESRMAFPDCGNEELGLYPLVDSLDWLKKLLPMGIQTIQLRIKDGDTATVESVIDEAVQLARKYQARLFINDYWKLAIKTGAYGVHLGQEDLVTADLTAIQEAGLRLGTSVHSYRELAGVAAFLPSYIAIGTVYPTPSKPGLAQPLGVEGFRRLCRLSPVPVVAIGGIHLDNAEPVLAAGANGIAVISAIRNEPRLEEALPHWQALFHADISAPNSSTTS
jgi:hydroxymethylpyrimidine kinase/phosphomethylpyrimidine kinase/thiamine-phosphate diphosphorylase